MFTYNYVDSPSFVVKKMRKVKWEGVYPAVTTKFFADGTLDVDTFMHNIDAQVTAGVHGVVIGGSLGESSTITHQERMVLLQKVLEKHGESVDVILNIAEGSTVQAKNLAQKAEKAGAHGLMVLPPMMYKATDQEVAEFYQEVAAATQLPIMLYNNPVDYKIEITIDIFEQLLPCQNITAVKESTRDISNVTRLKNRFGDRFKILCGVDTLAMEELLMGADGWVAGLVCAFPEETMAIYNLVKAGQNKEALRIYRWFLPLLELDIHPQLVQNIKLAEKYTGLGNEYVRAPRKPLQGAMREKVVHIIETALKNRPQLDVYENLQLH